MLGRRVGRLRPVPLAAGAAAIGVISQRRLHLQAAPEAPLQPTLYRPGAVDVVPRDWCFVTADDRLLLDGIAINPHLVRHGRLPELPGLGGGLLGLDAEIGGHWRRPCLFVGGDPFGNYYHWLLDFTPRLAAFVALRDKVPELAECGVALVGSRPAFVAELLDRLRFPMDRLVEIDATSLQRFDHLLAISNFSQYGFVHPAALALLEQVQPVRSPAPRRRLYVSRADAASRRVRNEDEVLAGLAPCGVEAVTLAGLGLAEQQALFADCELLIGPHGAGLVNLLWTPPRCGLVEIRPPIDLFHQFERLAAALGRTYRAVWRPAVAPDPNGDFTVDAVAMATAVATALRVPG